MYLHVYIYRYISAQPTYVGVSLHECVRMCRCVRACTCVCMHVHCAGACMHVPACMRIACACACVHVRVCLHMCVCIHACSCAGACVRAWSGPRVPGCMRVCARALVEREIMVFIGKPKGRSRMISSARMRHVHVHARSRADAHTRMCVCPHEGIHLYMYVCVHG